MKHFKKLTILISCFFTFLIFCFVVRATMTSDNYQIWADAVGVTGGEDLSSESYGLRESAGEPAVQSATSTSESFGLKAGFREMYQDQALTFSLGATTINFGEIKTDAPAYQSHTMIVGTNADEGFSVVLTGESLANGGDVITKIGATADISHPGTKQFGFNLAANTVPVVGANPAGTAPIGTVNSPYGTANYFAFNSGDTIASATGPINQTTYTVSYIVNIDSSLPKGSYSTVLTYTVTGKW